MYVTYRLPILNIYFPIRVYFNVIYQNGNIIIKIVIYNIFVDHMENLI